MTAHSSHRRCRVGFRRSGSGKRLPAHGSPKWVAGRRVSKRSPTEVGDVRLPSARSPKRVAARRRWFAAHRSELRLSRCSLRHRGGAVLSVCHRASHRRGTPCGAPCDARPTEVGRTPNGGYRAVNDRSRSVLGLSTSALPEQRPSRPSLEAVTNDQLLRLPLDSYRSSGRTAGADGLLPKERLDGCQFRSSPKGLIWPLLAVEPSFPRRDVTARPRSSKKWLHAQRRKQSAITRHV